MNDGNSPGAGESKRKTATEAIECIAEVMVAMGRRSGFADDRIRRDFKRAFYAALKVDSEFPTVMAPEGEGPVYMVGPAGMFRLVFDEWDLDRDDQFMQESWFVIANRAMEDALARTRDHDH